MASKVACVLGADNKDSKKIKDCLGDEDLEKVCVPFIDLLTCIRTVPNIVTGLQVYRPHSLGYPRNRVQVEFLSVVWYLLGSWSWAVGFAHFLRVCVLIGIVDGIYYTAV